MDLSEEEENFINDFVGLIKWHPEKAKFPKLLSEVRIDSGAPIVYGKEETTDCRTAYGKALLDLAKLNQNVVALTADLKSSVMTKFVSDEKPEQYIEVGIGEQNMVSMSGGLSLIDYVPFCSTFGAFMSSRAKDQARVNDINYTNVKMVATHCGLSVGEDGPTHQAIDDAGSFLGMFNTMTVEPADPNHTDRIIRYIASHYGNFYMRMGRHKIASILKEDGTLYYDENYKYEYGKCDVLREGKDITIAAMGSLVTEAMKAYEELKKAGISAEIVVVSSIKKLGEILIKSIQKTERILTVEDHNKFSGLSSQLAKYLEENKIKVKEFKSLGSEKYQLSGKPEELYDIAGLSAKHIAETALAVSKK
ncbi:MAG: transketolase C-terminal domain-containing protein [Candidatus Gracilibacteria bacterium]